MHVFRLRWAGVLVGSALLAAPAAAGPLDAPTDRLKVWLVERVGAEPRAATTMVTVRGREDRGTFFSIGFERRGRRPDLRNGSATWYSEPRNAVTFPVMAFGHGPKGPTSTPSCPAEAVCQGPESDTDKLTLPVAYTTKRTTESFYVVAFNVDVEFDDGPGWTRREVAGGAVRLVRTEQTGTGVRAGYYNVESFRGARAPGGRFGSVAFASLPCMADVGLGGAELLGGDPPDRPRRMDCGWPVAVGAASGPTTWEVRGEAAGFTTFVNRLAVFDLPPP